MQKFTDSKGQQWPIDLNVTSVNRVRALTDVNLYTFVEGGLMERLAMDPELLANVLYVICKDDAEKQQISDEEFGRRLDGDAIDDASRALLEALIDFFPKSRRPVLRKALEKTREASNRAVAIATKELDELNLDELLRRTPKPSSGSAPEKPAPTPDPEPSASSG